MLVETVAIDRVIPYARNPRNNSAAVAKVAASIKEFGWQQPIVVDTEFCILVGHTRLLAARQLGLAEVPVHVAHGLSPAQAKAYRLADNRVHEEADWDKELLALELGDLKLDGFDLGITGFDAAEIDEMFALDNSQTTGNTDEDSIPDPVPPDGPVVSVRGDVWLCGNHRIMCGDSTDNSDLERLLEGKRVEMVVTDPPYLMAYEGSVNGDDGTRRNVQAPIINDKLSREDGDRFLRDVALSIRLWCDGAWYVSFYRLGIDRLFRGMEAGGLKWRSMIVWKKNNHTMSNSDYKSTYEPILLGWSDDWTPVFYGWTTEHNFRGPKGEYDTWDIPLPSLWEIDRTKKNDLHPTMKPVALFERAIVNSSLAGQTVLDLFGGSGTTMIACERTARCARLLELEPRYVDTAVRRWQEFTGRAATLEGDGRAFGQIEGGRL